jgi:NADH-quinone oxidoreductase subunit H
MFMLAEYVNMTTVSALATTMFLGGWHAPFPFNLIDGANSGWWPLVWFVTKVWAFLFFYIWLRATLPRLRYDQFMALGWKVLIPLSLGWIVVVAVTHQLRAQGSPSWMTAVVSIGVLAGAALLLLIWHAVRHNTTVAPPPPDAGAFPVPPLPNKEVADVQGR